MTRWIGDHASFGWRSTVPQGASYYTVYSYEEGADGDIERSRIVCATFDADMAEECRKWEEKRRQREAAN